ncbi:MAG: hypothetical protein ACR2GB_04255 [Nocardioidaceae bacterium]
MIGVLLAFLVATAIVSAVRPGPTALVAALSADVVWLFTNSPVEGPILLPLGDHHGLTVADLAILATGPGVVLCVDTILRSQHHQAGVPLGRLRRDRPDK